MRFAPLLCMLLATPALADEPELGARTHSFLAPTGALVPAGKVQVTIHELGLWNDVALGVTDWLELSVAGTVWPNAGGMGHIKVRPTPPSSPFRLAFGAGGGVFSYEEEAHPMLEGSVTGAYQTSRVNVHATVGYTWRPTDSFEARSPFVNGGVVWQFARKWGTSIGVYHHETPFLPANTIAIAGMKFMSEHFDFDFGLGVAFFRGNVDGGNGFLAPFPMLSITGR